ncbi:hypothetical protein D3C76_1580250 [compost metagenome]
MSFIVVPVGGIGLRTGKPWLRSEVRNGFGNLVALILLGVHNSLDFALCGGPIVALKHSLRDFEPDFACEFVIGPAG